MLRDVAVQMQSRFTCLITGTKKLWMLPLDVSLEHDNISCNQSRNQNNMTVSQHLYNVSGCEFTSITDPSEL